MDFSYGDKVIIKGNLVGIILSGYIFDTNKDYEIYRVAVDATETANRVAEVTHMNQVGDEILMSEDFRQLFLDASNLVVISRSNKEITLIEKFVHNSKHTMFVNGFDQYIHTFYEIRSQIEVSKSKLGTKPFQVNEEGGVRELMNLAKQMTAKFEDETSETDWNYDDNYYLNQVQEFILRNNL